MVYDKPYKLEELPGIVGYLPGDVQFAGTISCVWYWTNLRRALATIFRLLNPNAPPVTEFKVGDKICKPQGYKFPGTIVAVFATVEGHLRYVAQLDDLGLLYIFNETQLTLRK